MVVYKITNIVNSKIYIGCTMKSIQNRFQEHIGHRFLHKNGISRAILKHGAENFTVEEVEKCISRKEMFNREIYWIGYFNSCNVQIGYNMTNGGDSGPIHCGDKNSSYGKPNNKLAEFNRSRKGIPLSESHKKNVSIGQMGGKRNEDTKEKMRLIRRQKWAEGKYSEIGAKISAAKKGVRSKKIIPIICINNYKIYEGSSDAALKLNLSQGSISNVINGEYGHTKGYVFQKLTAEHLIF